MYKLRLVGVVVLVVALSACGSPLEAAVDGCDPNTYVTLDDAGLFIDGLGDKSPGVPFETIACILLALDVPDSVVSRIDSTTSLQGMQEASWDGFTAQWTYHPSNGLDIFISR